MAVPSFAQQLGVRQVEKDVFESIELPFKLGNSLPIAYGGCAIGVAIAAAVQSVSESMFAYSVLGHFLGPARTDRKFICRVIRIRDTKTFSTRRVITEQQLDNGSFRACLELTADFQVQEPAGMVYTTKPRFTYAPPEEAPSHRALFDNLLEKGLVQSDDWIRYETAFGAVWKWLDTRHCPEGVSGQNLGGVAKKTSTTQDGFSVTDKVSADWCQFLEPLPAALNAAGIGFIMDAGIAFTPLMHNHQFLEDAAACSTLDFALRLFTTDVPLEKWHLRERSTTVGNAGRTYSEGKMYDTRGNLVASMTQQCILRPVPGSRASL